MMDAAVERFRQVEEVFNAVLDRGPAYLDVACGGDDTLRAEVRALLASYASWSAELPAAAEPEMPRFGPYLCDAILGSGGMGTVYRAHRDDGQFAQSVAIKVLRSSLRGEWYRQRFLEERQILARLNHPHIARLLDGGMTVDGEPYLVMELVEGEPIEAYCSRLALGAGQRIALFQQVLAAVEYAHRNLVVHRDLKPSNVLVTAAGEAKLLDFGTSKLLEEDAGTTVQRALTPRYASPEQLRGEPLTTATDTFSLGVMLYELICGEWPFGDPQSGTDTWRRLAEEVPPKRLSRSNLSASLAADLTAILGKALEHQPRNRYRSVGELSEDLRRLSAREPVTARRQTFTYRWGKFVRRHWLATAATVAFVLALSGATLYSFRQREIARKEARTATASTDFLKSLLASGQWGVLGKDATLKDFAYAAARNIDSEAAAGNLEPEVEAAARSALAFSFAGNEDFAAAQKQIDRLAALAAKSGSTRAGLDHLLASRNLAHVQGRYNEATGFSREAYSLATRGGTDPLTTAKIMAGYVSDMSYAGGATQDEEIRANRELLRLARGVRATDFLIHALTVACQSVAVAGEWEEGTGYCREAIRIQETLAPDENIHIVYWVLAKAAGRQNDWKIALELRQKHMEIVTRLAGPNSSLGRLARSQLGRAEWMTGDREGGLRRAAEAAKEAANSGETAGNLMIPFETYADLLARSGRGEEAEKWARRAIEAGVFSPTHRAAIANSSALGAALAMQGKFTEAALEFERALRVAKQSKGQDVEAKTLEEYLEKARRGERPFDVFDVP